MAAGEYCSSPAHTVGEGMEGGKIGKLRNLSEAGIRFRPGNSGTIRKIFIARKAVQTANIQKTETKDDA